MKLKNYFLSLPSTKVIALKHKLDKLSHAYVFIGADTKLVSEYLRHIARSIVGGCNDCLVCSSCQKEIAKSNADIFYYPKDGVKIKADEVDLIIKNAYLSPMVAKEKVIIINSIENMAVNLQNKLLKTLEEPPKNTIILMSASSEASVLKTILSRCSKQYFKSLESNEIYALLDDECENKEKLKLVSCICGGNYSMAKDLYFNPVTEKMYEDSVNYVLKLRSSQDVLQVNHFAMAYSDNFRVFLSFVQILYRDMLMIKSGLEEMVLSPTYKVNLVDLSSTFSKSALIESVNLVASAFSKLDYNASPQTVCDSLSFSLLEVKHSCL